MRNFLEMRRRWFRLNHSLKRFLSRSKRSATVPPDDFDAPSFGLALTLEESVPTELELNAAIARRHLEDLRAIFGRDNEDIERLADLWPPVPQVIIEEELLGG